MCVIYVYIVIHALIYEICVHMYTIYSKTIYSSKKIYSICTLLHDFCNLKDKNDFSNNALNALKHLDVLEEIGSIKIG